MKLKHSLPILALPLLVGIMLLVMQLQVKTNATSLRRGALFPSQRSVIPKVPVLDIHDDDSHDIIANKKATTHEQLAPVVATAPSVPRPRRGRQGTGDACIGPICGLGLFFVSLALTFATCVVVVYVADKRYDKAQRSRRHHGNYYENNQKRRASNGNLKFGRHCATTVMRRRLA